MHRGVAFADFDNDGRIDAVVSVVNGPAKLFHNIIGRRIALAGGKAAADGVRIVRDSAPSCTCGSRMAAILYNQATTAVGYACSSEPLVRFGLGSNRVAETIEVRWPGGDIQQIENVVRLIESSKSSKWASQRSSHDRLEAAGIAVWLFALTLWGGDPASPGSGRLRKSQRALRGKEASRSAGGGR